MAPDEPKTTIGLKRVRIDFNPNGNESVSTIKGSTAVLIDYCERYKQQGGEVARLASLAQTAYEEAAMWAVKAATA